MDRRAALALVAGAATSLAGCSGFASSSSGSSSDAPGAAEPAAEGPSSGSTTDPDVLLVRVDTDRQPIWLSDPSDGDDGRPTLRPDARHLDSIVVDSTSRADRLVYDPAVDATEARSFLSGTDFGAETVFVETIQVEECFRLDLCRISWHADEVSTDYARRVRPWDEACAVDSRVFETRLVRIPETLDPDEVRAESTSVGTGACHRDGTGPEATGEGGSGSSSADVTGAGTGAGQSATSGGGQ